MVNLFPPFNKIMRLLQGALLTSALFISLQGISYAVDDITALEQSFFNRDYSFDTPDNRVARLEQFVIGKPQDGYYTERLAHLMTIALQNKVNLDSIPLDPDEDLGVDDNTISALKQQGVSSYSPSSNFPSSDSVEPLPEENSPDATTYPLVTDMEHKLFHQGFENEPVNNRLARLEQAVFQQAAPQDVPLAFRVDKLTAKVLPNDPSVQQRRLEAQYVPSSALRNFPQNSSQMASTDLAIYGALNGIEIQVLGRPFSGEPLVQRISRLETRIFGRIQAGTIDSRFDQIAANYQTALQRNWMPQPQAPGLPPNFQVTQQSQPVIPQVMPQTPPQFTPQLGTGNFMLDLAQLENRVFGKSFEQTPVPNRLTNLEIQMMNQTFVFMRPEQRIVQLMVRASQVGTNSQVGFR